MEQEIGSRIATNSSYEDKDFDRDQMVYIYSGLILATVVMSLTHAIYFFVFCLRASVSLHEHVFSKIINACMRFYNKNPSGRILNRFSKDLGILDEYIPNVLFDVIEVNMIGRGLYQIFKGFFFSRLDCYLQDL